MCLIVTFKELVLIATVVFCQRDREGGGVSDLKAETTAFLFVCTFISYFLAYSVSPIRSLYKSSHTMPHSPTRHSMVATQCNITRHNTYCLCLSIHWLKGDLKDEHSSEIILDCRFVEKRLSVT